MTPEPSGLICWWCDAEDGAAAADSAKAPLAEMTAFDSSALLGARVVHCKRAPYDVYIGRPSKWGNPFVIGKDGDRARVIQKYREWLIQQPNLMAALPELKGKTLGCWCSPQACHGDVLAEMAGAPNSELSKPSEGSDLKK